ncbi:phasin family protein [Marilutibacter spongiae]|uniref:Phasin family protein n=1 Tax=Marilutibacter spongiae TaxID=2025720 RepID=A0A7W3Y4R4_9GAMM|nr:phasin family protein [Lysobacter spongiae]MBB1059402.1 phasin family protein [Lysobacter spongiae]
MAKQKKPGKKGRDTHDALDPQAQAEAMARGMSESAQQIWLAGVGAFARAQSEGNKLFESLVREGMGFEKTAREAAGHQAEAMREAMESRVGQARERANETWKRLETAFESRVAETLGRLGVPTRADIAELNAKLDALAARSPAAPRRAPAVKAAAAKRTPPATPRKTVRKAVKSPRAGVAKRPRAS